MKQKKKKFKMWNKLLAFLGMFVMLTGCLAGTVQAGSYEAGKKGSLNLTVQQTDEDGKTTPLTGVKLELYRVADVSFDGNVHFVLTSSMSSAGYDFDSFKNASEWYSAAEKLAEVAAASSVKPVEAVSDEQGKVVYSDMEEGMYLVIGAAESSVKVTPMLLTVPFASTEEGWIYDVQAYPKAEKSNTAGIIVEKRLYRINPNTFELDEITADDATYKVGLFLDKDGTIPYGDDYIRTIHIQNAQSGKASYSNVLRGTYYVFELDENNKAIKLNDEVQIDKENSFHYNVTNAADKEDNSVVVDDNTVATDIAAYVNNIFSTLPEGFFVNGKIKITKNVVVDGVKKTVDDKFYATVFDDSGKAVSTVELKQNDKVTVTVPFSEDIKDTVTYAVKETDKDGNVLDKDSFAYVVSGEGSVKLNESDQYHGSIEITNTKKDAAVTPGGSNGGSGTSNGGSDASSHGGSATSRPVKTGDPMNPVFWGLVLLVSVIVIAGGVVVYKKRKQK